MKKMLIPLLFVLALLSSCAPDSPAGADFDAFRGNLNTARQSVAAWTEQEKALLGAQDPDPALLTDDEVAELVKPREEAQSVLPEESAADVDLLFRALKSAYGAYDYLGGDAVFLPVKEQILAELAGKPPLTGSSIARVLEKYLAPVVKDGHFTVAGQPLLTEQKSMYYVPDVFFGAGEGTPARAVKPTIGPEGALVWGFAALSADGKDLPETGTVAGKEISLTWVKAENLKPESLSAYEVKTGGAAPVLACRTLSAELDGAGTEALAGAGVAWRDTPLFLADLRGNGGGNAMFAMEWFRAYADSDPAVKTLCLQNCSRLFSTAARGAYDNSGSFVDQVAANAGTWETALSEGGEVPNRSLIFILQDGGTASAGESFAFYLSSLENTIRVGANTKGCRMMGNTMDLSLPKSGVAVRFGSSLECYGSLENTEGTGLLPDLWVPPQEAEEAVMRLIRHYGLK